MIDAKKTQSNIDELALLQLQLSLCPACSVTLPLVTGPCLQGNRVTMGLDSYHGRDQETHSRTDEFLLFQLSLCPTCSVPLPLLNRPYLPGNKVTLGQDSYGGKDQKNSLKH